jgi:pimeloyl-ACP methyl ester carboxylesterase
MQERNGYLPVDGTSLYYEVAGEGEPIVLLHGLTFDRRMWEPQIGSLAERFTVVSYDLRGFGRSEPAAVPYSHAADLRALVEHLELDRPALVGLSMGGGAVINYAILHPGTARALVAICPSLGGYSWSKEFIGWQMALRKAVMEGGIEAGKDFWLGGPLFDQLRKQNPAEWERLQTIVREYSGWHWVNPDPGIALLPPAIERLGEIDIPSLIIVGEHDVPDVTNVADILVRSMPDAELLVAEGCGHMVNMEKPEMFNEALSAFLEKTESVRS